MDLPEFPTDEDVRIAQQREEESPEEAEKRVASELGLEEQQASFEEVERDLSFFEVVNAVGEILDLGYSITGQLKEISDTGLIPLDECPPVGDNFDALERTAIEMGLNLLKQFAYGTSPLFLAATSAHEKISETTEAAGDTWQRETFTERLEQAHAIVERQHEEAFLQHLTNIGLAEIDLSGLVVSGEEDLEQAATGTPKPFGFEGELDDARPIQTFEQGDSGDETSA